MRTVELVLFQQAFALQSVLYTCCQACWTGVQSTCSMSMSVDCRLPPPPLTSTTVDKIWILVLPPLSLLILFPCWLHVSSTWPLLAIYHGNDGDGGEVAGMSHGKWRWGSEASLPSRNVQELFPQYQPLIELPPTILPHVTRQVRFFLTLTRLWLTLFCLETTSSHSFLSLFSLPVIYLNTHSEKA